MSGCFRGLYRVPPGDGPVELLVPEDEFEEPNGLCFSPDESLLYVNDSSARKVKVCDPHGTCLTGSHPTRVQQLEQCMIAQSAGIVAGDGFQQPLGLGTGERRRKGAHPLRSRHDRGRVELGDSTGMEPGMGAAHGRELTRRGGRCVPHRAEIGGVAAKQLHVDLSEVGA